jgi:hypothetical protein
MSRFASPYRSWTLLLIAALGTSAGCTTFATPKLGDIFSREKVKESKYPAPARIVAIWSPATLNVPGKPPIRGFGGRLYFYNDDNQAVPVEGQLVVYAYDDTGRREPSKTPDKRFGFKPEQLASHYSPGSLGASYSIWIPWDPVGGPAAEISLVPAFTSSNGKVVMGQPSRNSLPGRAPDATQPVFSPYSPMTGPSHVQQASYQAQVVDHRLAQQMGQNPSALGNAERAHDSLQSTSITLPQTLAQRMAASRPYEMPLRPNANPVEVARQAAHEAALPQEEAAKTPARTTMGGVPQPWTPPDPRLTRFVRQPRPVPGGQSPQPVRDPSQWQPAPSESPFGPRLAPQLVPPSPGLGASSAAASIAP